MGYRGKLDLQDRARELRAAGATMPAIAAELGVSKASVSLWTRDVPFVAGPRRVRARGPNALQQRKAAEIEELRAEGARRIGELSDREFLVAGAALYAGEGAKRDGRVRFANSDPALVRFFLAWLRRFHEIDESRLRVQLYLHDGLDLQAAIDHWSAVCDVPSDQFIKPYRAVADSSIRSAKHVFGCVGVYYDCSRTHRAIMGVVAALLTSPPDIPG